MKSSIIAKLETLQERYIELQEHLADPAMMKDQELFRVLSCEYAQLSDLTHCFQKWQKAKENVYTAETMLNDPEMHKIAQEEISENNKKIIDIEKQLRTLMLPKDSNDESNCYLEIRAGTGGDEAALFAGKMFRMYSRYAESNYWKIEVINSNAGEHGGFKEIIARVIGCSAYGHLKFESGGHRVQRIPATENQGRIHTSSCTVAVMPEIPKHALPDINPDDLRIDTFRSSGAGGQHVNTTDSAVRITHLPTRVVVECQDERSQHKNKAKALSVLAARIRAAEIAKQNEQESFKRRNLLGSGDRSDRNRTYNFIRGRVTDHRINLTLYRLDEIMEGNLDLLIESIVQEYQADQLALLCEKDSS
ncbi:peptide chain release factor 1 [Candidatus Profftia tarda]|uniref:Peptide chain release factor 1 n=1 Tax=Candidatus Profftia tarda TaxID=1177216 RepID=A0A8E4GI92_9ENTR|nr:peptide chain release factor 1 [Candidatus Profftia tarda]CAD6512765.1 Peptide chain release factor 1 [Candidatus Profftia tarda]